MARSNRELWYALAAIAVVSALYALAYGQAGTLPAASGLVGHGIGILGFVLMLMTETLYSMRKRLADARWGSMASWLRFHIATGLVGPYMVVLHTATRFGGVAGVAMLLTGVVVLSGVVGRYIYTTAPHSAEGERRGALAIWHSLHVPLTWALFATAFVHMAGALYYATLQR